MKVCDPFVLRWLSELNWYQRNNSIENSPAESDCSLPCLSSDDTPYFCRGNGDAATSGDTNNSELNESHGGGGEDDSVKSSNSLPSSDVPIPSSPNILPASRQDTYAIRPFPLLHLMLSPSFAAIRDLDDVPGM